MPFRWDVRSDTDGRGRRVTEAQRRLLADPPEDSRTQAAADFGIDLTLTARNYFELSPAERLDNAVRTANDILNLQQAYKAAKRR